MIPPPTLPDVDLPEGWSTAVPEHGDAEVLAAMRARLLTAVRKPTEPDVEAVTSEIVGIGSWTRRQMVVRDPEGRLRAWACVHDRAAGRVMPSVLVDIEDPEADRLAGVLWPWCELVAQQISGARGVETTQLDVMTDAGDERERRWLSGLGYAHTRTWLQMSRPVDAEEELPAPREGVVVRRVRRHELDESTGLPVAEDLQTVHLMLEESFADHFNSYRESFPEFVQRLREDPGHRWDHWWIAEVDGIAGGALVSSVLGADDAGREGSYIDYIGVHRDARGRGVAKALLHTVITDAAGRGRSRVGLEVDADSPTAADQLYLSMGWETRYRTESWHRDVDVPEELMGRPDRAPDEPDLD
ncbi:GNAT family N-acetyltransferase [Alteromonas gracilis]